MTLRSQRRLIATLAAHERWAKLDEKGRREATALARKAAADRWMKLAREQNPDLPEDDLAAMADNLKSAHYARMALKSAQSRARKKAAASKGAPA